MLRDTNLAIAFSRMEGFGRPGAQPTVKNNPGDLRHGPHASHDGEGPNDIGIYATPELGWEDLETQLQKFSDRNLTVQQAINIFAPASENDPARYLAVVDELCPGCTPDMLVRDALLL